MNLEEQYIKRLDDLFNAWKADPYVVYNPFNKPFNELPYVIGFQQGETKDGMLQGYVVSQDGYILKEAKVEDESWFWIEFGLIRNYSERSQHEYRKHYPDGYKTIFIRGKDEIFLNCVNLILQKREKRLRGEDVSSLD